MDGKDDRGERLCPGCSFSVCVCVFERLRGWTEREVLSPSFAGAES